MRNRRFKGIENIMSEWNKDLWIASKTGQRHQDIETGELVESYEKPVYYKCNYQKISGFLENSQWGALALYVKKGIFHDLDIFYDKKIKLNDLAYLDGANPEGELQHGNNANYVVVSVEHQNEIVVVHFQHLSTFN